MVEVGLDGKPGRIHRLDVAEAEAVTKLRAFTTAAGKTYLAAFAGDHQRMRLFDLDDKERLVYPEDALQNRHNGIADVELLDLDGDGAPEIYIGFWGVVGVHAVALDGKRLWVNRSLANVSHLAAGPAAEDGRRDLICTNILNEQNGTLVVLNAKGQPAGVEFALGKRAVDYLEGPTSPATAICSGAAHRRRGAARTRFSASTCKAASCGATTCPANRRPSPSNRSSSAA